MAQIQNKKSHQFGASFPLAALIIVKQEKGLQDKNTITLDRKLQRDRIDNS